MISSPPSGGALIPFVLSAAWMVAVFYLPEGNDLLMWIWLIGTFTLAPWWIGELIAYGIDQMRPKPPTPPRPWDHLK